MYCEDGPNYRRCVDEKRALFVQGANLVAKAVALADDKTHRGLLKRLLRKVW
jgi:hypothetical protein